MDRYVDPLEERRVIAEFAKRRKKIYTLIALIVILTGGVLFLIFKEEALTRPAGALLMVAIFAITLFGHLRIWRCPHCNGHLGRLYLGLDSPRFCPQCGIRLVEKKSGLTPP